MLPDTSPLPEPFDQVPPDAKRVAPDLSLWIAILAAGIAGNAGVALSPLLLSGMAQFLKFGESQLGQLAAATSIGSSLVTVAAIFFMDRKGWPLRLTVIVSLCLYGAINAVMPVFFDKPMLLQVASFFGGCCSGMIWSAAATGIMTARNNERLIAVFYGTPYLTGLVVQPLMPFIFASGGLELAYFGMAGASVLALLAMRSFPARAFGSSAADEATGPAAQKASPVRVLVAMVALFLQYAANSGLWVFFDRIGHVAGHSAQASANVVALGSGMALGGTALAALLTRRLRPVPSILLLSLAMGLVTLGFLRAGDYLIFAASVALFNAMITFITPFFFILLGQISANPGRAALGANICMMGGFAFGPLAVGQLAADGGFGGAIVGTAAAFLVSGLLVLIGVAGIGSRRQTRAPSPACGA